MGRSSWFLSCKILLSIIISGFTVSAYAQYYMVYSGPEAFYSSTSRYYYGPDRYVNYDYYPERSVYTNYRRYYDGYVNYGRYDYDYGRCYSRGYKCGKVYAPRDCGKCAYRTKIKRHCYTPCDVTVYHVYSHAPKRHAYIGSEEMAEYAWIPTPEAP